MHAIEIMEDLFFIERGYLNANHFVYRSEAPVLIDTAYVSDFDHTERVIKELGVNVSDVRLIVSTHCHCDHVGGNRIIQDQSGCDIVLHKIGKHFIDTSDDWSTWWKYYNQDAAFFSCTKGLEDGDIVQVGPHEFEVLYTPGHAADGVVLYNAKEKVLLSSDTLWENDMAVMTLRVEGSAALFQMQDSLERLKSLDVRMVYPGHGRPFSDMGEAIERSQKRISRFMADRELVGLDLLKKIIVYTLMMRREVKEGTFFAHLMETRWFKETVELYCRGDYETTYEKVMAGFLERGIVRRRNGALYTTVKP
jgi:glyoxylase-like metal-dependent hydrolase (beta-lactamase superfamily II)